MLGAVSLYLHFKFYNMVFKLIQSGVDVISASKELMEKPSWFSFPFDESWVLIISEAAIRGIL